MASNPLASSSVPIHLLRGAVGIVALLAAVLLSGPVGPVALLGLPIALVAWRGCPGCWAIGLAATREGCLTGRCAASEPTASESR